MRPRDYQQWRRPPTGEHRNPCKETLQQLATCRGTTIPGKTQETDDPTPDARLFNSLVWTSKAYDYNREATQRQVDQQAQDRQHSWEASRWYLSGRSPRTGQPHLQRYEHELVKELLRLAAQARQVDASSDIPKSQALRMNTRKTRESHMPTGNVQRSH